jgi:hypothetical protein
MKSVKKKVFDWIMSGAHKNLLIIGLQAIERGWYITDQPPIAAEVDLHIWKQIRDGD